MWNMYIYITDSVTVLQKYLIIFQVIIKGKLHLWYSTNTRTPCQSGEKMAHFPAGLMNTHRLLYNIL